MPIDVFISYRGADRVLARKLEQRLRSRWGSRVFRDETSLMAGRSWSEQLTEAMSCANVMLALIGQGWHVRADGEDWVKTELLGAIEAGHPVLPVLVGDPDELAGRLTELPAAFQLQAVKVSSDLAGFDLHKIERALRNLGAFGDRAAGGLGQQLSDIVPQKGAEITDALLDGRSVVVSGASGSGRSAMLRRLIEAAIDGGGLVATCGVDLGSRTRRTHGVVASWVDDLCTAIQGLPPEDRAVHGPMLVNAVIDYGPDLLAREVLRPARLLPLGDDDSDQKILEAARRPTDRWAPFPPERLVSQSESVIRRFAEQSEHPVTLLVDNLESIDGSSRGLIKRLLRSRPARVSLVLATSAVRDGADPEPAEQSAARALAVDIDSFSEFASISLHDATIWGRPGEVIEQWLERHHVRLGDGVSARFVSPNPYYALSALWYLVDNGYLVEPKPATGTADRSISTPGGSEVVTWVPARPDEDLVVPSRDRLLDHMVEEFVPVRFREIIEAGSLIGRRFPFSAAFAVAHPPESIDEQLPSVQAIERWRTAADEMWAELAHVDPDGSVIVCHRSADGERMISLAQYDLVAHLTSRLDRATTHRLHERLAQYFAAPIAGDVGTSLDDRYTYARAAATHWASARRPRKAADAERFAAGLAEQALAYPEARRHYQRAIRLFTQLLAQTGRAATVDLVDHEDLLILASCLYRLGQMTRLANERGSIDEDTIDPAKYFRQALRRLQELSVSLHDKRLDAPTSPDGASVSHRDLPQPNIIRHHIRLCETMSGWVNLELAEWHDVRKVGDSRQLLFEALRHAEAARGEADSRWLLAAASSRLAQQLVDDAGNVRFESPVRSHNLAVEALFQIERVIGLAAVSPDEDRNLEEPRSRAWMVLGQLFQTLEVEPGLAEWAFRRMNEHRNDVSDLVDMMTDRRLGLFLLSTHRGGPDGARSGREARDLLERHARWAVESGIAREHSGAYLSLALLELVEQAQEIPPRLHAARELADRARECASDDLQEQNAYLLRGVLHAIEHGDEEGVAFDDEVVLDAFRRAALDGLAPSATDREILYAGWRISVVRLLRWCPHLKDRIGLNGQLDEPHEHDESRPSARRRFLRELAADPELADALTRADSYLDALSDGPLTPSNDTALWRLLRCRVPTECFEHALRTRTAAERLLVSHRDLWDDDPAGLGLLARDIEYAVAVHEWYRSTDPSRLLTLARESNMTIDGAEWASPKLLSGRLALQVLDGQYAAAAEIGRERFRRISSMVTNWAEGSDHVGPLEQIFYVAIQMEEPTGSTRDGDWRELAHLPGQLSTAYRMAVDERTAQVRQAGLPLMQDLHLLDADAAGVGSDQAFDEMSEPALGEMPDRAHAQRSLPRSSDDPATRREPARPVTTSS